ncbi:MAG: UDP-glucose 4-epimerase GalE [Ruminococcaceae bacterium]|nr:UDP-glucose 4-epimerase GalE [Oscillospiraceae bacterium]
MSILITGGAGFIGSHTCVELLESGYDCVVIDNLSNSSEEAVRRVEKITGKTVKFYEADVRDKKALHKIFEDNSIEAVIHFAGYKAVGESVEKPLMYYENNLTNTLVLLEIMKGFDVKRIVFSSSATVYGSDNKAPLNETMPVSAINPYGRTKLFIEEILKDVYSSDNSWSVALLRYFNPVGAHKSGLIGEAPKGIPNNLMPYISQVAVGKRTHLNVFGNDYKTADGTGSRDYIHVVDLAKGHVKAIEWVLSTAGCEAFNLGTGKGTTVLELRRAFVDATGVEVPFKIAPRRAGDCDEVYASADKAKKELNWSAELGIEDMCKDTWNWQKNNPEGYDK